MTSFYCTFWRSHGTAVVLLGWLMGPTSLGFVPPSIHATPRRASIQQSSQPPSLVILHSSFHDAWNPINRGRRRKPKKDFYTLLEIAKTATKKEIKAAYRRLAKKYHPDANRGDNAKAATEQFQAVARAYEVLSDPKLKKKYDLFGEGGLDIDLEEDDAFARRGTTSWADWTRHSSPFGSDGGGAYGSSQQPPHAAYQDGFGGTGQRVHSDDFFGSVDFGRPGGSDFFSNTPPPFNNHNGTQQQQRTHSSRSRTRTSTPMPGSDLMFDLQIDMKTAMFGGEKELQVRHLQHCDTCQGSGLNSGTQCPSCMGKGTIVEVTETPLGLTNTDVPCVTCRGTGTLRDYCNACHGEGLYSHSQTIKVKIPAGAKDGKTLCLEGKGDAGLNGAPAGNLYVYLKVLSDYRASRRNNFSDNKDGEDSKAADPLESNGQHAHTHYHDYVAPPNNGNSHNNGETYDTYLRNNHEAFQTKNGHNHNGHNHNGHSNGSKDPTVRNNVQSNRGRRDKDAFFRYKKTNGQSHVNGKAVHNHRTTPNPPTQKPFVRNGFNDNHDSHNGHQANGAAYFRNAGGGFGTFFDRHPINHNGHNHNNGHNNNHNGHNHNNGHNSRDYSAAYSVGTSHGFKTKNHHNNGFAKRPSKQDFFKTSGASYDASYWSDAKGRNPNFVPPPPPPPPPAPPSSGGGGVGTAGATQTGTREIVVGEDLVKTLEVDVRTARTGGEMKVGFRHLETCLDCEGIGHRLGPHHDPCPACGGTGLTHQTSQTPLGNYQTQHNCHVCRGTGRKLGPTCKSCRGQGTTSVVRELRVQIPPNTEDGNKLYLRGEGDAGPFGGPPGDLYVYLRVKP